MAAKKERYQLDTSGEISSGSVRARQNSAAVEKYTQQVESQSLVGTAPDARISTGRSAKVRAAANSGEFSSSLVKAAKQMKHLSNVDGPSSSSPRKLHARSSHFEVADAYDDWNQSQ